MARKKHSGKCVTKYCRNDRAKHRTVCHKCFMRKWRERHPARAAYRAVVDGAKRRKILCLMTFEEFCQVIGGTDYLERSGTSKFDLQLDRIDATKAYSVDNVRVVTCSENAYKSNWERRLPEHQRHMMERKYTEAVCDPF